MGPPAPELAAAHPPVGDPSSSAGPLPPPPTPLPPSPWRSPPQQAEPGTSATPPPPAAPSAPPPGELVAPLPPATSCGASSSASSSFSPATSRASSTPFPWSIPPHCGATTISRGAGRTHFPRQWFPSSGSGCSAHPLWESPSSHASADEASSVPFAHELSCLPYESATSGTSDSPPPCQPSSFSTAARGASSNRPLLVLSPQSSSGISAACPTQCPSVPCTPLPISSALPITSPSLFSPTNLSKPHLISSPPFPPSPPPLCNVTLSSIGSAYDCAHGDDIGCVQFYQ
eukprot:jgi/Mesen1/2091/ME000151S01353